MVYYGEPFPETLLVRAGMYTEFYCSKCGNRLRIVECYSEEGVTYEFFCGYLNGCGAKYEKAPQRR